MFAMILMCHNIPNEIIICILNNCVNIMDYWESKLIPKWQLRGFRVTYEHCRVLQCKHTSTSINISTCNCVHHMVICKTCYECMKTRALLNTFSR